MSNTAIRAAAHQEVPVLRQEVALLYIKQVAIQDQSKLDLIQLPLNYGTVTGQENIVRF